MADAYQAAAFAVFFFAFDNGAVKVLGGPLHCGPALDLRLTDAFAHICAHRLALLRLQNTRNDGGRRLGRPTRLAIDSSRSRGTQKCRRLHETSNLGIDFGKFGT
ncbi:hypothetical protein ACOBR2_01960 [Telmatobacter bradus]|uniref:hypothetical protein n=1 Tax=Telmatobacter bradus TaxID=474953 RepID=UPI003B42A1F5